MSHPKKGKNLAAALRRAYVGPFAAKRLAADTGSCIASAKMALRGDYPRAWERFLALIEKRPDFLANALKTTWSEELALKKELSTTKRRLEEIETQLREGATRRQHKERRVAEDTIDDREDFEPIGRVDRAGKVK